MNVLTEERRKIVELKSTDNNTLWKKYAMWAEITKLFHGLGGGKDRDAKVLKSAWKRLKESAKKQKTEESRQAQICEDANSSDLTQRVCALLPQEPVLSSDNTHDTSNANEDIDLSLLPVKTEACDYVSDYFEPSTSDEVTLKDSVLEKDNVFESISESIQKNEIDDYRQMSSYDREMLKMARNEHEAKMENFQLKRRLLLTKIEYYESLKKNI